MQTYDDYAEAELRPYTEGLSGDANAVQRALALLEYDLWRDLVVNNLAGAALQRAGAIAASRRDLPLNERLALVEGVLRLQLPWIDDPLSHRSVAYPLLDAIAMDEDLPAYLRSDALNLL